MYAPAESAGQVLKIMWGSFEHLTPEIRHLLL